MLPLPIAFTCLRQTNDFSTRPSGHGANQTSKPAADLSVEDMILVDQSKAAHNFTKENALETSF